MATKKFDQDKAFKNILGVSDDGQPEEKTPTRKAAPKKQTILKGKFPNKKIESSFINPIEKRSQRTSITVKPSEYEKALNNAKKLGVSFNEIVNQLLEKFNNDIEK